MMSAGLLLITFSSLIFAAAFLALVMVMTDNDPRIIATVVSGMTPSARRQARWDQLDLDVAEWRIPAIEMKAGKHLQAHTVPLSMQAIALVPQLRELSGHTDRMFPSSGNAGGFISENTINNLFRRMGYKDRQSHHGLRASARSLLSERGWTTEALERQLDHKEANKAVAAYARSQHLDERRRFMGDWGMLVEALESGDNVVPLHRAG